MRSEFSFSHLEFLVSKAQPQGLAQNDIQLGRIVSYLRELAIRIRHEMQLVEPWFWDSYWRELPWDTLLRDAHTLSSQSKEYTILVNYAIETSVETHPGTDGSGNAMNISYEVSSNV